LADKHNMKTQNHWVYNSNRNGTTNIQEITQRVDQRSFKACSICWVRCMLLLCSVLSVTGLIVVGITATVQHTQHATTAGRQASVHTSHENYQTSASVYTSHKICQTSASILLSYNAYRILWHVLPVNLLVHPVLLASGSHYIGYQLEW